LFLKRWQPWLAAQRPVPQFHSWPVE
jgi:hypothetical protein